MLLIVACDNQKQQVPVVDTHVADSLQQVINQKETELDDMLSTFNEIEEGFRQINAAEQRATLARQGEGSDRKARIRESVAAIQQQMTHNRELINKLRQQLRESSFNSDQLKSLIENMTQTLQEKEAELADLRQQLEERDVRIDELDTKVHDLNVDVTNLSQHNQQKEQTISNQDKALNTAWFVFGTKSELKEQNILSKDEVLRSNFNKNYFTKIDIRIDKEIKLYSKSAKIMTNHPASSYTLQQDANKQYILRITNPQQFWSASKYLVILVK